MKRILLSVVTMFAVVSIANAQGFHVGAKAGANMTKIDGQSFQNGYELGYQLGGFVEIDFSKNIGIQPELLFSQTNTKVASEFNDIYENIGKAVTGDNVKLNYLSIPVLLRINAGKLLTFHVGPQFSILMNADENLLENGENAFKKGDFAAVLGAQVNLGSLRVFGRYNIGLSDINDIDNKDNWKNQQIQLGVGFKIL
jgi:hypothetical protein